MKKPACASKRDMLELATLRHVLDFKSFEQTSKNTLMSKEFEPFSSKLLYQLIVVKWAYETNVQSKLVHDNVCRH